jgi:hypothetical protein
VRDQVSHPFKKIKDYGFVCFNLHISRQQTGKQKIPNCMVGSIPRI